MWSSYSVCTRTSNDPIIVAFEYGSLAFVYGLLRTCAFKYESLVFVHGLQVEVVLRKSYSVAQDTILIHHNMLLSLSKRKISLGVLNFCNLSNRARACLVTKPLPSYQLNNENVYRILNNWMTKKAF